MRQILRHTKLSEFDLNRLRQQAIGVRLRRDLDYIVNLPIPPEWLGILKNSKY